ncbi:MAG: 50S ribosomal protein L3 [Nanoarchaeota archaeon]
MPTRKSPRKGSLQFWPRKRAKKFLPSVNWKYLNSKQSADDKKLSGFVCYKVGMKSAYVTDNTSDSMTSGKKIIVPCTILACPKLKILSVRFHKNNIPVSEILNSSLDKTLKKRLKIPKNYKKNINSLKPEDYEDISILVYTQPKKLNLKKVPDISEIGLSGSKEDKLNFVKENLNKEISIEDFIQQGSLIDIRGVTKGKGTQGPVKRFGIHLKVAKSEKGQRRPGSIGPWHPARVTFRVPMAGQTGLNTRVNCNNKVLKISKEGEQDLEQIKNFGNVKTDYILLRGSVPGPTNRQLILTKPIRVNKKQLKKDFEFIELR